MADVVLSVDLRERTGTGGARETRRNGDVPGVIYGGPLGPVAISFRLNEVKKALNTGRLLSHVIEIDHKGTRQQAIARDIQFHPVTDTPLHIDLYRVESDQVITVEVAVRFLNEEASPGLKRGGVLNIVRHAVELNCPAGRIPAGIDIDLTGYDIGDTIHASAMSLPEGVSPAITDRDFTIATLQGSRAVIDPASPEGEEAAED
ncbi:MAG: 50S ribosomal protein L25/general stress protein Ctc [Maricaulaceae bacterium]